MNVVELNKLLTERKLRIGLDKLKHPLFFVLEIDVAIVYGLTDTTRKLVDELLLVKTVNLFRNEGLVVTKCR